MVQVILTMVPARTGRWMSNVEQHRISISEDVRTQILLLREQLPRDRGQRAWQSRPTCEIPDWLASVHDSVWNIVGRDLASDQWWANVADQGCRTEWHDHPRFERVAVVYVTEDNSGIEFREGAGYWRETPQQGDLLMFSGRLAHRILPNPNKQPRISIAFNFVKR